jgi:hypothetical protein
MTETSSKAGGLGGPELDRLFGIAEAGPWQSESLFDTLPVDVRIVR